TGATGATGTISSAYGTFTSPGGSTALSTTAAPVTLTTSNAASNMTLDPANGTVTLTQPGTYQITYVIVPSATVPESTVGLSFNGSTTPSPASTTTINANTSPNTPIVGQEVYTTTSPGTTVRIIGTSPTSGTLTYSNANLSIIKVSD
ncbi:BclA C-terminal domain-containing protein, partial [Clostridium sp.]|uniref:BclA C-terminal domain-containing protein n=1 Tax=Clostridium sp. TaxID=1506 RepID=UPI003BB1AD4A